jgi:hypothetical protein
VSKMSNKTMTPSKNGVHDPKKVQAAQDQPQWQPAFSNYAGDAPLGIDEIYESLMALTGGWPKVISQTLCCRKGEDVRPLKTLPSLFAWLRRQHPVDWKRGSGLAVPMEQFHERLLDQDEEYAWASAHPHFPAVPGVYYTAEPPKAKNNGKLDELLDRFSPETAADRELIRAFVLTLFWGGAAGQRPQFVVVADPAKDDQGGRGTGKTKLVELLAHLVGGCIDIQPGITGDRVVSNLLSPTSWARRLVLVDNLKTLHYSNGPVESYITRSEITGHRLHQGFAMRPNLLTWAVTVNGASFSTDMARRSVVIYLKRPKKSSDAWYTETKDFIDQHRKAIVADVRWHLEVKAAASMNPPKEDTWADWRKGVLSRCEKPDALVKRMEKRRKAIDGDKEDMANTVTHVRACLQEELPNATLDAAKIWIPSQMLIRWLQMLKPRLDNWQASTSLKMLPAERFVFQHRKVGNGYWWVGAEVDEDHPPKPKVLDYRPNVKWKTGQHG